MTYDLVACGIFLHDHYAHHDGTILIIIIIIIIIVITMSYRMSADIAGVFIMFLTASLSSCFDVGRY